MPRLELKNGQWLDVKDDITMRDESDRLKYSSDGVSFDAGRYHLNSIEYQIGTAAVWITDWSVKDKDGKPIQWPGERKKFKDRVEVLEKFKRSEFRPIGEAIAAHADAVEALSVAEKNETPTGGTDSGPSSPSVN